MSLPDATIDRLKRVLHDATASVYADGDFRGTAFFVDGRLLLTCEHVVPAGAEIEIEPMGRARRPAEVVGRDEGIDLALLEAQVRDEPVNSCAVLDTKLTDGEYWLAGFPREEGMCPGLEMRHFRAGPREHLQGGGYQMLQIGAGEIITWGMSGGPALNARTGAVAAVTCSSKDTADALGGGAVPVAAAAERFEDIARLLKTASPAMVPWRNALGRDGWQSLGRSWNIGACVDLRVSGKRNAWQITLEPGPGHGLTGRDLGEDVAEALFRWAQRRRVRDTDEVSLLGPLLASALFPRAVANHLSQVGQADNVLVRLHVEHGNDLADIPWELAAVPGEQDRFLAADERFRFVRVSDTDLGAGDSLPPAPPLPGPPAVRVLAAVAQPGHWQRHYPVVLPRHRGAPYRWPKASDLCARLRESVERAGFVADVPSLPRWSRVEDAIKTGTYTVFHFMGVGQRERDGTPLIAFVDADGNGESWVDPRLVIRTAAAHGVRLVVLELLLPPNHYDYDPLTPSALGDVITGSVTGVVLTQLPVHPRQCHVFNLSFYEALGRGESVETAVQAGRRTLKVDMPVEDAAGFGWFPLVTVPQSDIHLVSRALDLSVAAGLQQPSAAERAVAVPAEPRRREAADVLHH
ncbi:MAG TPA: serine protease [Streptosporangiaceae bacterium]